jgi:hypothetical protein
MAKVGYLSQHKRSAVSLTDHLNISILDVFQSARPSVAVPKDHVSQLACQILTAEK